MKPRTNCKTCMSPHRAYIEEELGKGTSVSAIVRGLAERGEKFSQANITAHKRNHWHPHEPTDEDQDQIIRELESEMRMSPPTVAAAYLILIKQLRALARIKPSPDSAVKTAQVISAITGMRSKQQMLLAFAERAFQSGTLTGNQGTKDSTEVLQLPAPMFDNESEM